MTTSLPPKAVIDTHIPTGIKIYGYNSHQMREHGAAEYARAIQDAAVLCERLGQHAMAMAMRKLGATP